MNLFKSNKTAKTMSEVFENATQEATAIKDLQELEICRQECIILKALEIKDEAVKEAKSASNFILNFNKLFK